MPPFADHHYDMAIQYNIKETKPWSENPACDSLKSIDGENVKAL